MEDCRTLVFIDREWSCEQNAWKWAGRRVLNMCKNLRPRSKITCRLQTVFIRSDKLALLRQKVGSDLDPNCLAFKFRYLWNFVLKTIHFENTSRWQNVLKIHLFFIQQRRTPNAKISRTRASVTRFEVWRSCRIKTLIMQSHWIVER